MCTYTPPQPSYSPKLTTSSLPMPGNPRPLALPLPGHPECQVHHRLLHPLPPPSLCLGAPDRRSRLLPPNTNRARITPLLLSPTPPNPILPRCHRLRRHRHGIHRTAQPPLYRSGGITKVQARARRFSRRVHIGGRKYYRSVRMVDV
jgi:hypothetical protein